MLEHSDGSLVSRRRSIPSLLCQQPGSSTLQLEATSKDLGHDVELDSVWTNPAEPRLTNELRARVDARLERATSGLSWASLPHSESASSASVIEAKPEASKAELGPDDLYRSVSDWMSARDETNEEEGACLRGEWDEEGELGDEQHGDEDSTRQESSGGEQDSEEESQLWDAGTHVIEDGSVPHLYRSLSSWLEVGNGVPATAKQPIDARQLWADARKRTQHAVLAQRWHKDVDRKWKQVWICCSCLTSERTRLTPTPPATLELTRQTLRAGVARFQALTHLPGRGVLSWVARVHEGSGLSSLCSGARMLTRSRYSGRLATCSV